MRFSATLIALLLALLVTAIPAEAPLPVFEDITDSSGITFRHSFGDHHLDNIVEGTGSGACFLDFDNDGFQDIYFVTGVWTRGVNDNQGRDLRGKLSAKLYRNRGYGQFENVTETAGVASATFGTGCSAADYDNDGDVDLYLLNYGPNTLYRNNGDGTFTEVTKEAGVFKENGRAMSASAADLNNDGYLDIYVANDAMENSYYENTGKGTFVEKAIEANLAYSEHGQGVASMGPAIADVNRDGWLDIFIPDLNYSSLLVFDPKTKIYENRTDKAGLAVVMGQYAGWASALIDYDNDGWPDVFTVHGNAHHEFVQEDTLARNRGNGTFQDVSADSGPYFHEKYVGRGGAYADIDNDGDLDIMIVNLNDSPRLLRNDGGSRANWLLVDARLVFPTGERTAIGARVTVRAKGLTQIDDVNPVRGYLSQNDPRLHFGLADSERAEVEIRWPGGIVEHHKNVKANQILKLTHPAKAGTP